MDFAPSDLEKAMSMAANLAQKARGRTAPNPMVGAVIFNSRHEILGSGFHAKAGEPHAEINAIRDARRKGHDLRGTMLVVTLEPCNHHGRTPPCVDALVIAGFARVVVGTTDPNPLMSGKSFAKLREAGIEVVGPVSETECKKLIRGFRSVLELKRPFITLKAAATIDGKIATSAGESKWITGEPARMKARAERAEHDSILVGVETILADDPRLDAREVSAEHALKKIVLDTNLRTPVLSNIFRSPGEVVIYCDITAPLIRRRALEEAGATVVAVTKNFDGLRLDEILSDLARRGTQELFVEGGARVLGSFVRQKLFDRMLYFIAPKIFGGGARDVFEGFNADKLTDGELLRDLRVTAVGRDILVEGTACSPA